MNEKKETILFVDDEKDILEVVSVYFTEKGYQVITAKNGVEAVDILKKEKIDCCFSDINMPEMDGLQLAEYVRQYDNTIPVIILTGHPSMDYTIQTLKNGVVDFLIKPTGLNQMELCLRRVLRERQLFIENLLLKEEIKGKERLEKINKELSQKVEEMYILNRIMEDFSTISSSSDVFKTLVDMAVEIIRADEAKFYVMDETLKMPFEIAASFSDNSGNSGGSSQDIGKLLIDIANDRLPLLIPSNQGAANLPGDIVSFMAVPISIREKVFGVVAAFRKKQPIQFTEKELYYLSFMTNKAAYTVENIALYENIYENMFATLFAFVKAIEARDPYTKRHSSRVTSIAKILAEEMGCSVEDMDILYIAGMLHDIGKIGIQDSILLKPGMLTSSEYEIIKAHPIIGANIVGKLGLWDREQQIIRHHHERFDGSGYPDGLKSDNIPFLDRILSVADVYDAMASDRIYREKMDDQNILSIISKGAGTHFDPDVVNRFQKVYKEGKISEFYEKDNLNKEEKKKR